jgi:hypothetical protein
VVPSDKEGVEAIEAVRDDRERAYIKELLTANQRIVVVADGGWSHEKGVKRRIDLEERNPSTPTQQNILNSSLQKQPQQRRRVSLTAEKQVAGGAGSGAAAAVTDIGHTTPAQSPLIISGLTVQQPNQSRKRKSTSTLRDMR